MTDETTQGDAPDRVRDDAATARTLLSGALVDELGRRLYEYEHAIDWNTSCLACPAVLDSAYEQTCRAERAEATVDRLRSVLLEGGQDADTVRRRALAILSAGEAAPSGPVQEPAPVVRHIAEEEQT